MHARLVGRFRSYCPGDGLVNTLHLSQAKSSIFKYIHQELDQLNSQKFPIPDECSSSSLKKMLGQAEGPISLILDEGNALAKIPKEDLSMLLQVLRSLKHAPHDSQRPDKGLASLIVIGTEGLPDLLKEGDSFISSFSHVSS